MKQAAVNPYLKTQIMTASPLELRLMLYDGALKFARQARLALEKQDLETSYNNLVRAQKIVLELSTRLKRDVDPQLCDRLAALYTYIYRKLVDANMNRRVEEIDEAIKLLDYERQTWQMLITKLSEQEDPENSQPADSARQTAMSTWSKSA
ncbi:MAG: flagellar export chaperone FliS [Phycisphaeraceae bacterium]|nr:flagellar export chaperone FliS [Phycisphaeraceae bacterium]